MEDNLNKLIEKIENLRKKSINESQTKEWLIKPFFELLGWDFSNPDEVVPEDDDSTGKRPDYSFLINNDKKFLLEAKAIDNKLDDVKMITEKMNYCSNSQVPFLIITNGILYKIYYSKLDGASKDKVLFDFTLNNDVDEEVISRLHKNNIEKDELLKYAQETYILSNVKKTLENLFQTPPRKLLSTISENMKQIVGYSFSEKEIETSLQKFNIEFDSNSTVVFQDNTIQKTAKNDKQNYTIEDQFNAKKWIESYSLYNDLIKSLKNSIQFKENPTKVYIGLITNDGKKNFCQIQGQRKGLKAWVNIDFIELTGQEKLYAKDVSNVGHHGMGNTEIFINSLSDFSWCINIIIKAFNK
jgi:hypothetical protein